MFAIIWTVSIYLTTAIIWLTLAVFGFLSGFIFWDIYARCVCWLWVQTYVIWQMLQFLFSLAVYGFLSGSISLRLCITELVMTVSCVSGCGFRLIWFLLALNWLNDMIICNALYYFRFKSICECFFCFFHFRRLVNVYFGSNFWTLEFTWLWIYWM